MKIIFVIPLSIFFFGVPTPARRTVRFEDKWVCNVKRTCVDCLQLPFCSWCETENKCFSEDLPSYKDFCPNSTKYKDYGLSLENNAQCKCLGDKLQQNCFPPGAADAQKCSNRGVCECGRCFCNPAEEVKVDNYTIGIKYIIGEYCEYDNFSCDGPECNDGPYNIYSRTDEEHQL